MIGNDENGLWGEKQSILWGLATSSGRFQQRKRKVLKIVIQIREEGLNKNKNKVISCILSLSLHLTFYFLRELRVWRSGGGGGGVI